MRREERETKDELIKNLKKEIENTKRRIDVGEQDLKRVQDDMTMIKRQVKVRPPIQPTQGMGHSAISVVTSEVTASYIEPSDKR